MPVVKDTIAAVATPPGQGGIGVIRVSGPQVKGIGTALLQELPQIRKAVFTAFRDAKGQIIDQGLALYFSAPHSFTGEDVLELHGHGSPLVLNRLMQRLFELGSRQAKPGEFSERAFLNGKIDLLQAEAIADLINSASEAAAKSAARSLVGEFSQRVDQLKVRIIQLRTLIEALMDFSDEEISVDDDTLNSSLSQAITENIRILEQARQGVALNEGLRISIVGPPNVGKSSLLNRLLQEERAIVTEIPGTTRDTLTEKIIIDGVPFIVTDTAGLRETEDPVEQEGIKRTIKTMEDADLAIVMNEFGDRSTNQNLPEIRIRHLYVINKIDRHPGLAAKVEQSGQQTSVYLSAKTGEGLDLLKNELIRIADLQPGTEGLFSARQRHIIALQQTHLYLEQAKPYIDDVMSFELAAENLRLAQRSLGEITGDFTTEDLLDEIFSGFCIGK